MSIYKFWTIKLIHNFHDKEIVTKRPRYTSDKVGSATHPVEYWMNKFVKDGYIQLKENHFLPWHSIQEIRFIEDA